MPRLLRNHVGSIPIGPVLVPPADTLLVLAMRRGRAPKCGGEITVEAKVALASTRPGNRTVSSWSSQLLPSGSLNDANEA